MPEPRVLFLCRLFETTLSHPQTDCDGHHYYKTPGQELLKNCSQAPNLMVICEAAFAQVQPSPSPGSGRAPVDRAAAGGRTFTPLAQQNIEQNRRAAPSFGKVVSFVSHTKAICINLLVIIYSASAEASVRRIKRIKFIEIF